MSFPPSTVLKSDVSNVPFVTGRATGIVWVVLSITHQFERAVKAVYPLAHQPGLFHGVCWPVVYTRGHTQRSRFHNLGITAASGRIWVAISALFHCIFSKFGQFVSKLLLDSFGAVLYAGDAITKRVVPGAFLHGRHPRLWLLITLEPSATMLTAWNAIRPTYHGPAESSALCCSTLSSNQLANMV